MNCIFPLNFKIFCNFMNVRTKRSRGWVFTYNNWVPERRAAIMGLLCKYVITGEEVAPDTGTPHLQGFIYFVEAKSHQSVRTLLSGCHVEAIKGTAYQAASYCKKDGNYEEVGVCPLSPQEKGANEEARWTDAWEAAKRGDIENVDPRIRLTSYTTLKRIKKDFMSPPEILTATCGIWIWGESGSGKTHAVFAAYPEAYLKNASKWWDGYQGQDVAFFDDVDPSHASWIGRFFKVWADKYPFIADDKGGSLAIRPKSFIVTSQYEIDAVFLDKETRDALKRRFIVIKKEKNQNIII
nr:MAG: replication associated protein [Cressdnaviricota sp.]